jgi:hypothetical protein
MIPDTSAEKKPFYPVIVGNSFAHQRLALAAQAEPIFCLRARHHIRIALMNRFDALGTAEIKRVA